MNTKKNIEFFHAVSCGDVKKVKRWLDKGVSPNFVLSGSYPLLKAVDRNNTRVVSLLLDYGARRCGLSPLVSALEHYNYAVIIMLIERGNMYSYACGLSYLFYYYCRNITDMAKPWQKEIGGYLLECGADPFEFCFDGSFPLWVAAEKGNITAVKLLVKYCRENNRLQELIHQTKFNTNSTPLYLACQNEHCQVVECLLNAKVDPNIVTKYGATPLFVAAERGYHKIVHLLLLHGADPTLGTRQAMHVAFERGHDEIGDLMCKTMRCRLRAIKSNVKFFIAGIESDTLVPYVEQWAPHFPYQNTVLFDFMKEKLITSIVCGVRPPKCLNGIVRFLPFDQRVHFFTWLVHSFLLQKVVSSTVFTDMFFPVHDVVASFLEYPHPSSRSLLALFYCNHLHEFDTWIPRS